ncbi:MAG: hypothetical protein FWD42_06865 [Solirubrobacterales bacterium]|nr:hypothetical protein [Solirubrobacterales bacterium]
MSERLARGAGALLERRFSRRGVLGRAALVGSALAVAPLRYLLRPVSAWAVIGPGDCRKGLCTDGYTAFCCEINGGANTCPADTYVAGWWKCSDYLGSGLCHGDGPRYYVDCNRMPGREFAGGCKCALDSCAYRRVDCNRFRYGQCNTQVIGTTEVACRVIVCEHPATVPGFNCNATEKTDNTTCKHDANCLKPLVSELLPQGGA